MYWKAVSGAVADACELPRIDPNQRRNSRMGRELRAADRGRSAPSMRSREAIAKEIQIKLTPRVVRRLASALQVPEKAYEAY